MEHSVPHARDSSGRFLPGYSPNPGGKLHNVKSLIRLGTNDGQEIVDKALELMRNAKREAVQMEAVKWLGDRLWGKIPLVEEESDGKKQNIFIFLANFFKIVDSLNVNESLRPELRRVIREAIEAMEIGEPLQNQRQELESHQPKTQQHPKTDLPESREV